MTIPSNGAKRRTKLNRWYPHDPPNTVSCNITEERRRMFARLAETQGTTLGSLVRQALEAHCGKQVDEIEATLS